MCQIIYLALALFRTPATSETLRRMREAFGADKIDSTSNSVEQASDVIALDFEDQLISYRFTLLPKRDLWVCPICYAFLESKRSAEENVSDGDNSQEVPQIDPLIILGKEKSINLVSQLLNRHGYHH